MIVGNHTFWPSFPALEVAFNTTNNGLWYFSPTFLGVFVPLDIECDSRGDPKRYDCRHPYICAFPPNVVNNPQHCQHCFMGFWCECFWVKVDLNFNMRDILFFFFQICNFCDHVFFFYWNINFKLLGGFICVSFSYVFHESMSWMLIDLD